MPSKKKPTTSAKPPGKAKAGKSATPASETTRKSPQKAGKKARARNGPATAKSSGRPTAKKQAPKKRVGVVRKVAGGLVAGALKGVASVVEKAAGIDEGGDAAVSREIAKVREEVTSAKADLSQEIAAVREEVGSVNEEVGEISEELRQVTDTASEGRSEDV